VLRNLNNNQRDYRRFHGQVPGFLSLGPVVLLGEPCQQGITHGICVDSSCLMDEGRSAAANKLCMVPTPCCSKVNRRSTGIVALRIPNHRMGASFRANGMQTLTVYTAGEEPLGAPACS
jgi:hypothetical protein